MEILQTLILISGVNILQGKNTMKINRQKRATATKLDFGLSASMIRNMNPEDFVTFSLKPMIKEIVERLRKLKSEDSRIRNSFENEDKKIKSSLEGKNTALNYILLAISYLGATTLIIIAVLLITLEKKHGT